MTTDSNNANTFYSSLSYFILSYCTDPCTGTGINLGLNHKFSYLKDILCHWQHINSDA